MYKRRDWLHLHGEDGGDSSDSDDDSSGVPEGHGMAEASGSSGSEADSGSKMSDGEAAPDGRRQKSGAAAAAIGEGSDDGSLGEEEGSLGGYESEGSEPASRRRIQDFSEDDFESDGEDEDLEEVKRAWLDAPDAETKEKAAGRALKCRACNGKLILNAMALRQHVASKRHLQKLKGSGDEPTDTICFADRLANDENVETHQERTQRLQQEKQKKQQAAAAAPLAVSKSSGAAKRRRKHQRKQPPGVAARAAAKVAKPKGKPGKRQREALKGAAAAPSAADTSSAGSVPTKQKKAKRQKVSAT